MTYPAGTRVLIVEDEPLVAMMLEDMLCDLGLTVVGPATSLADALELVASGGFDAALLDVNLNEERVYPVADLLRERGIPFAFATGYGAPESEQLHHAPILHKPYRRADIGATINGLLGMRLS